MPIGRRAKTLGAAALLAFGFLALYRDALQTGFLNDDYLFLEEARTDPVPGSLAHLGALGNYYRPLSRQVWFAALTPLAGGHPLVFHLASAAAFAGALALLFDLLSALLPLAGALVGTLVFVLLPLQRVNLTWISCSQDLLALLFALASLALWRRGRTVAAAAAFLGAVMSKEAALPFPLAVVAWEVWVEGRTLRASLARARPLIAIAAAWGVLAVSLALAHPVSRGTLRFGPVSFVAALVHGLQSVLGLEDPAGLPAALAGRGPDLLPLVLLAGAGLLALERAPRETGGAPHVPPRHVLAFAACWFVAFALVTGPVAAIWSSYFYTLPAVGAAIAAGVLLRNADRWVWAGLVAVLLWWHAGVSAERGFAVVPDPWGWSSHLTAGYFERGAEYTTLMSSDLQALEPAPPHGTRFFFATLPYYAGFQMGNGALVRTLYRDPTLESHFYTQFSETTAADRPCRFFFWNGGHLRPLYGNAPDPFFQVGSDLLIFGRWAGAAHAFRRALAAGGDRADNLTFLGWAELWNGHRATTEAAWKAVGAADDTTAWRMHMNEAVRRLTQARDTLGARRELAQAIRAGMGRPEAHAWLGALLMATRPKYATLELIVATRLDPQDEASQMRLLELYLAFDIQEAARQALDDLLRMHPERATDPLVLRARERLGPGTPAAVVRF